MFTSPQSLAHLKHIMLLWQGLLAGAYLGGDSVTRGISFSLEAKQQPVPKPIDCRLLGKGAHWAAGIVQGRDYGIARLPDPLAYAHWHLVPVIVVRKCRVLK